MQTIHLNSKAFSISNTIYRSLIAIYPLNFKQAFKKEMLQVPFRPKGQEGFAVGQSQSGKGVDQGGEGFSDHSWQSSQEPDVYQG